MEMMAFISGIFIHLKVEGKPVTATEVNFLCVHKILRRKRVAPVLIKEVTRRSNVKGVWQGVRLSLTFYSSTPREPSCLHLSPRLDTTIAL